MSTLPMQGLTHGKRSPVTCHLKCGDACALPPPNRSTEPTFPEIASLLLTRRKLLLGGSALAAGAALPTFLPERSAARPPRGSVGGLPFAAIAPVPHPTDALTVPDGYRWDAILRWGDPLFDDAPPFDPSAPSAAAQERQFGYNNDYLDILVLGRSGRRALLCGNHEFVNRRIMFPPTTPETTEDLEVMRTLMAAVGFSVVELERPRRGQRWHYVRGGRRNRRITATTPFLLTGAAAGSDLVKTAADPTGTVVLGTLNNCAGGTTPWGTILSGEENVDNFFKAVKRPREPQPDPRRRRYGLIRSASVNGWEAVDLRFDATQPDYVNEPHRFGYIVEIDPFRPRSTPRKHTALGRFKHEGANIRVDENRRVAAYMGDDQQFEYLYKFVARRRFRPRRSAVARQHNLELLTEGDLYAAQFLGELHPDDNAELGTGRWLPLVVDGASQVEGMSHEGVLVFTREAADKAGATPMDRCEDVEPHPQNGKVYVACTNNTLRGLPGQKAGPDPANPRDRNRNGHVIEITEDGNRADATTFSWNLFLVCGEYRQAGAYFGGWDGPVSPISCPDNLAFDSDGNLWVATDGAQGIGLNDGLFKVPLAGPERGRVQQFLAVPTDAETCGPVIHDRDGSVFVAVQHPGEEGRWDAQQSFFPDYAAPGEVPSPGNWRGPRPSVVQVTRIVAT